MPMFLISSNRMKKSSKNPKDTIFFDEELHHQIDQQKEDLGADGTLLKTPTGEVYYVNMLEKLLATNTCKNVNFVPEAGIWLVHATCGDGMMPTMR